MEHPDLGEVVRPDFESSERELRAVDFVQPHLFPEGIQMPSETQVRTVGLVQPHSEGIKKTTTTTEWRAKLRAVEEAEEAVAKAKEAFNANSAKAAAKEAQAEAVAKAKEAFNANVAEAAAKEAQLMKLELLQRSPKRHKENLRVMPFGELSELVQTILTADLPSDEDDLLDSALGSYAAFVKPPICSASAHYMYVCVCVYTYIYIYIYMCEALRVCVYVHIYTYMYMYMCVYVHIQIEREREHSFLTVLRVPVSTHCVGLNCYGICTNL